MTARTFVVQTQHRDVVSPGLSPIRYSIIRLSDGKVFHHDIQPGIVDQKCSGMNRAAAAKLSADDYRNHPDLSKIIPPNDDCLRNPDGLSLSALMERDGALAAPAVRRAEERRAAFERTSMLNDRNED